MHDRRLTRVPHSRLTDLAHVARRQHPRHSNRVVTSKTHATGSGLSPVSLLHAVASHASAVVTKIGRTMFIRRATKQEQEQYSPTASNGFSSTLHSLEEAKPAAPVRRASSSPASNKRVDRFEEEYYPLQLNLCGQQQPDSAGSLSGRSSGDGSFRKASSKCSSSAGSLPPPIFDQVPTGRITGVLSDDSAVAEG